MTEKLECPTCGDLARLTDGSEIYNGRFSAPGRCFWCCRNFPLCDTYVGCRSGSREPLGTLADRKTRKARRDAHVAVDALWDTNEERSRVYVRMEEAFGFEVHMGSSDVAQCRAIIAWAKTQRKEK